MTHEMLSHCPACGAEMQIFSTTRQITCSFCGNRYNADLTGSQPILHLQAAPGNVEEVPPDMPVVPKTIPETPPIPAGSNTFDLPPTPVTPRVGAPQQAARRPIWLMVTLAFGGLLCLIFGCMAVAYMLINNGVFGNIP